MGARERLPVGREDVRVGGGGRPPRDAEVGARERLPVGRADVRAAAEGGHLEVLKWARENDPTRGFEGIPVTYTGAPRFLVVTHTYVVRHHGR